MRIRTDRCLRAVETLALLLLAAVVLWKGGKSLDATWVLAGVAVVITFADRWLKRPSKDHRQLSGPPLTLWTALMLFLAWSVISLVFSETRNYGLDEILRDVSSVLMFLWVAGIVGRGAASKIFLRKMVTVIAVTTLVACAIGIAVYVLQPVNRFVGTFFDWRFTTDYWPNAWGEFLLLSWPLVVLWSQRYRLPVTVFSTGAVLGCLLLSYSRGSILVFMMQAVFWMLIVCVHGIRSKTLWHDVSIHRRRWLLFLIGTAAVAAGVFGGVNALRSQFHDVESVMNKATFTASEGSSSISERRDFWRQAFTLSLQRPLIGSGPYSFRFLQPRLQTAVYATSDHPHNVFLKLAMERGWPAAMFFAAILASVLFPALRRSLRHGARDDGKYPGLTVAALIAVTGVLLHNLIDYNLQFVAIALPFWMLLGAMVRPVQRTATGNRPIRVAEIIIAVLLGCVTILEGRMLILSSLARHAQAAGDSDSALQWYDAARGEMFSRDMHLSRGALYLGKGDLKKAFAAFDDYARVNSHDARVWILRGDTALASGNSQEALQYYFAALERGKYNYLEPLEGILSILRHDKEKDQLSVRKNQVLDIYCKFSSAILANAHFIALSANVETFDRVGELLSSVYPREKDVQELRRQALEHADGERAASVSRPPGLLW